MREWIYRILAAPAEGARKEVWPGRSEDLPGVSAVCRLQTALGFLPRRALSSAEAIWPLFPVSVSLRVCRKGNGEREYKLVAFGVVGDFSSVG